LFLFSLYKGQPNTIQKHYTFMEKNYIIHTFRKNRLSWIYER
jgi:hypothetical protein